MLRALGIRDFVIAERVELETGPGFTVLTGETGAGKSILVDAVELLVGGRGDAAVVREGAERAELSAEFEIDAAGPLAAWLAEHELDGDPGILIIRRVVDRQGRSRSFLNGHAVTLAQLRDAGERLVDIHGQHAHQSLLRAAGQRDLLDAFAGAEGLAGGCAEAWRKWKRLETLASEAQREFTQRAAERAEIEDAAESLRRLALREGEWEELSATHRRLAHGSALLAGAQAALEALAEAEGATLAQLSGVTARLRALAQHDDSLRGIVELLASSEAQVGEAVRAMRQYASRLDPDPETLAQAERRIEALHAAARRHRVRPESLPARMAELTARLAELDLAASPEVLEREVGAARTASDDAAKKLSEKRKRGARALSRQVSAEMQALGLAGGRFSVHLRALQEPTPHGREEVEFEFAAHASLPLRSLAKVASGGELSRLSLAIHLVASRASPVDTLVFDEVDAGIGGAVAELVGRSLRRIGAGCQVLCVTHLPQVAAQADAQWSVTRQQTARGVVTRVAPLDRGARIEELARMLAGTEITATTRKHAAELLGR